MPPKQTTCSICGETVNKAKTYHIGDGKRACKKHEGVTEKADELRQADLDRRIREREESKRKKSRPQFGDPEFKIVAKCGFCARPGLRQDEFHLNTLKAMERMRLREREGETIHPFHPEYHTRLREYMISPDAQDDHETVCLWVIQMTSEDKLFKRLKRMGQMEADSFGVVMVCPFCVKKLNLKDRLPKPPDVSIEQLSNFGVVYEVCVRPEIVAQVEEEAEQMEREET
jgi:hypothetical protein